MHLKKGMTLSPVLSSDPGGKAGSNGRETRVSIGSDLDIIKARQTGRTEAAKLGFSSTDQTLIATAISELARNVVMYARQGEIVLRIMNNSDRQGIMIIARDEGPGIADVRLALQDGYSTSRSLGLGLPGVRRLMDEFVIESELGKGTVVTIKKWANSCR